ncbi:MAG: carboxypeptidase regulatory-like domain-containing protein [Planctomycetes bacterium]|nr:carboxypeptidase regulatory-like domain-containing protein [Planctomycetota bacterium]
MAIMRKTKIIGAALACLGMMLPTGVLLAAQPSEKFTAARAAPQVRDVALAADGSLRGRVVSFAGIGLGGVSVVARLAGREVARATSDKTGYFSLAVPRGGVYEVQAGSQTTLYRLWAARTAPPAAAKAALIVAGEDVLRAQMLPFKYWLVNPYFIRTAAAAAAIGIPIAVHNANIDNRSVGIIGAAIAVPIAVLDSNSGS